MKIIKLISLAILSSIFLNFIVYYSGYATDNILFATNSNFIVKSIYYIFAICSFIFFHTLFIAVKKPRSQTSLYYGVLIMSVIVNILIYQPIGISASIIDGLFILCGLAFIHFKFTTEYSNLIKPNIQINHNVVTTFLLFLAITISLNFFILNSKNKESLLLQIQEFTTGSVTSVVDFYTSNTTTETTETKLIAPQTIMIGNQKVDIPKIAIDNTKIKEQAVKQVSNDIANYITPYEDYLVPGASLLILISILSLSFIIHFVLFVINFLLYKILRLVKFINYETEMTEVKRIKL